MRDTIYKIYEHLGDDFSRELYGYRLLYSLTGDSRYIRKAVLMTKRGRKIHERLLSSGQKKILFGTGFWGTGIKNTFSDIEWECFADNNESKKSFDIPVISFADLKEKYQGALVVIATRLYQKEIYNQLIENGFDERNIINAGKAIQEMFEEQYFDLPQLPHEEDEVFVDVGCYDGMTTLGFDRWKGTGGGVFAGMGI